jgi:flavin reductase (DIM6/NTAB) family NADH-FMN oxidoreductase RutF
VYISKSNLTHELVYASGIFGIHLLRRDQWELIWQLGFQSARQVDKLAAVGYRIGVTGCPMLEDCLSAYECRVSNAMDAGAATFFLGDVVSVSAELPGEVMTGDYFRTNMPPDRKQQYEARLLEAQAYLEPLAHHIDRRRWPGPSAPP